jgi:16S rRNA (cytidine1402-2'-O)-methyltransferase
MLYIIPTPIGNLSDMTYRGVEMLMQADLVLAEDTRTSSVLLRHYGVDKPLSPFHQHNEHKVTARLVEQMLDGKRIALVTDAGTPGISDPAYLLVRASLDAGIRVECLPGATAFVPALVASGLPAHRFCFEGFLPLKKGRHTLLTKLAEEERTMLFYESPVRLLRTLENFMEYFGPDRRCSVAREISKKFEEHVRGSLQEVCDHFRAAGVKGEIVIVVEGRN